MEVVPSVVGRPELAFLPAFCHSCSPAGAPAAQIIHSYTLVQDKEALSETVANVRWLIAAGIRDFQAILGELHKL